MVNGSLVQFYPILFTTKGTVKLLPMVACARKKRHGK